MGTVTPHDFEHLAPSDQMVARTRRRLLLAARALRESGTMPPGVEDAEVFRGARSGYFTTEDDRHWQEIYAKELGASVRPQGPRQAA
jgi:hypothetical protein